MLSCTEPYIFPWLNNPSPIPRTGYHSLKHETFISPKFLLLFAPTGYKYCFIWVFSCTLTELLHQALLFHSVVMLSPSSMFHRLLSSALKTDFHLPYSPSEDECHKYHAKRCYPRMSISYSHLGVLLNHYRCI